MADFKTALEALSQGKLELNVLTTQLEKLLQANPKFAIRILEQLDDAHNKQQIDDQSYTALKRQINEFRRLHAAETENVEAGGDSTVFAQEDKPAEQKANAAAAPASDATQVLSDEEKGNNTGASEVDFDISMSGPDTSPSVGPATGPTGTEWEEPQQGQQDAGKELGTGDIIKQRFKLLDVLGIGGMGKVFKGIDLLKEEAKDKNPYIAIKLLNEDFKSHPEAFISLQRESSRQQKLAHPNIATVYDFDRVGGPGTPVYITMELMEGQPLNTYIKKVVRKQGGLPFDEAFVFVKQLSAALEYAHERRLVHSDFKPGNAFLCNDGTVKTLDFGIARAVKNPITGEAEKTLFDPGKLGALTPAYASLEMLEGEEPDTKDDTYALGCVAYELLTGKHPFNKLPATTARENGLVPAPVKGLNKKQNRALRNALAFKREDRSPTVMDFLEEFEGKATWYKNPFAIAAAVLLVIGLMLINPALDYMRDEYILDTIAELNKADEQVIASTLEEMREMEASERTTIANDAKTPIQNYFTDKIAKQIDISGNNYNFLAAADILKEVEYFYPESLYLQQQTDDVLFNKKQKITDLYQEYIAALDPEATITDPTTIDTTKDILNLIRQQIDPAHPLLTDPRPANAYRLAAQQAFADGNYEQATAFVNSGLQSAPDDARLTDLQTKIQNAVRVAQLNENLTNAQEQLASLDDYKQYQTDIVELAGLSNTTQSPVLEILSTNLKKVVDQQIKTINKQGTRTDAEALANDIGGLLSALQLSGELTQLKLAHLSGSERQQAIQSITDRNKADINAKLITSDIDNLQWESELLASVRELDSLKKENAAIAEELAALRESIAQIYVDKANTTLKANRFDAAETYVSKGERFAPDSTLLTETAELVASSKQEFEKQQRIADLKEQFDYQTSADRITQANQVLTKLKTELDESDPYIASQAPVKLADSYTRLAQRRMDNGEYSTALQLAEAGLALAPRNPDLRDIRDESRVEVNLTELGGVFADARVFTPSEITDLARKVNEIEQGAPARYPEFRRQAETTLAERINFLAQTDENAAAALADAATSIFPTSSVIADLAGQFQLEPWPNKGIADGAISAGELSRANTLLQEATAGEYSGHPQVLEFQKTLEQRMKESNDSFTSHQAAVQAAGDSYNALRQAKKLLARAQAFWIDNPDYDNAENSVDQLIANAPDNPSKRVIRREQVDIGSTAGTDLAKAAQEWKPVSSGRECNSGLAGYGSRARAICYDLVNTGWRGPLMVVVPTGGEVSKEFAIGKYELSTGDWSKYCALSGKCKPETNKEKFNDPVTGITLQEAQDYVQWLSERTGKTYRLPNESEWMYAASAGGALTAESEDFKSIKGSLNCRVTLGDKVLKGTGISDIKSGKSNQWGLKNFVGNVQEWVMEGNSANARGGAYSDSISNCDLSTVRTHDGNADDTTGFRVILDDVG